MADGEFYLRYYTGHQGKFGHEFLEFEFRPDGKLRYANNSNYKGDNMIRKEVFVNEAMLEQVQRALLLGRLSGLASGCPADCSLWASVDPRGHGSLLTARFLSPGVFFVLPSLPPVPLPVLQLKKIVRDSEIMREDDNSWPPPDKVGRQELEVVLDGEHISFTTTKIGSLLDVEDSSDPEGLRVFYYLIQVSMQSRKSATG